MRSLKSTVSRYYPFYCAQVNQLLEVQKQLHAVLLGSPKGGSEATVATPGSPGGGSAASKLRARSQSVQPTAAQPAGAATLGARLVALLAHRNAQVQTPALRAVGNVVTGDDAQTQRMLDLAVLSRLRALLALCETRCDATA